VLPIASLGATRPAGLRQISPSTRYADGDGLTAAERARREQMRLAAELTGLDRKET